LFFFTLMTKVFLLQSKKKDKRRSLVSLSLFCDEKTTTTTRQTAHPF